MMNTLQKLGKSLMMPVAVLPICGILMGLGYSLCPEAIQGGDIVGVAGTVGYFLVKAGSAVIDNMPWLFVVGTAVGMSDDGHGAAALAGIVSWLTVITLLSPAAVSAVLPGLAEKASVSLAFSKIQNPFIAILTGMLGAKCYNRFKGKRLPDSLAFFSGRRFVLIVTVLSSLLFAAVLCLLWPLVFSGLTALGKGILRLGGIGTGIYATLNRLLIPFGLHHALNNVFWFDTIGIGDLTAFWAGKTSADVGWSLGMYMSGFFPCMMFGIPGAALAMVKNATNKKKAFGLLSSIALCSFLCGVTEPFEFAFVYAAFPLYAVYSVLYGLFAILTYYTGFRAGFSFSGGAVDLFFSSLLPGAQKTWLILPLGIAAFAVFYFVFDFLIRKLDCKTPGRTDDSEEGTDARNLTDREKAQKIVDAIGGKANIRQIDCCATRLRISLADSSLVDRKACAAAGALGVVIPDRTACQLIIGVTVQQLLEEVKAVLAEPEAPARKQISHSEVLVRLPLRAAEQSTAAPLANGEGFSYRITDPLGMHARPAAALAGVVSGFRSRVTVTNGSAHADAASTISLMSLNIRQGSTVSVSAEGEDAAEALQAVKDFLTQRM